MLNKEIIKHE